MGTLETDPFTVTWKKLEVFALKKIQRRKNRSSTLMNEILRNDHDRVFSWIFLF